MQFLLVLASHGWFSTAGNGAFNALVLNLPKSRARTSRLLLQATTLSPRLNSLEVSLHILLQSLTWVGAAHTLGRRCSTTLNLKKLRIILILLENWVMVDLVQYIMVRKLILCYFFKLNSTDLNPLLCRNTIAAVVKTPWRLSSTAKDVNPIFTSLITDFKKVIAVKLSCLYQNMGWD